MKGRRKGRPKESPPSTPAQAIQLQTVLALSAGFLALSSLKFPLKLAASCRNTPDLPVGAPGQQGKEQQNMSSRPSARRQSHIESEENQDFLDRRAATLYKRLPTRQGTYRAPPWPRRRWPPAPHQHCPEKLPPLAPTESP